MSVLYNWLSVQYLPVINYHTKHITRQVQKCKIKVCNVYLIIK